MTRLWRNLLALSGLALGLPWAIAGCAYPVVALSAGIVALAVVWIVRGAMQWRQSRGRSN